MPKRKSDKSTAPITKEELGLMLHKYINPLYEKVDKLEIETVGIKNDLNEVKKAQLRMENDLDEVKRIQLRMENNLVDDNKLLHDRDDAHDKALENHEKRITTLEDTL